MLFGRQGEMAVRHGNLVLRNSVFSDHQYRHVIDGGARKDQSDDLFSTFFSLENLLSFSNLIQMRPEKSQRGILPLLGLQP